MSYTDIKNSIHKASTVIGKTWPLYSFVTSNPLSGYEHLPFQEAVHTAKDLLNARMFPEGRVYREAWERGDIDEKTLNTLLNDNGFSESPEYYLRAMEIHRTDVQKNNTSQLDQISAKWLAAFMDEGLAEWDMPRKEEGFYTAWRELAPYDNELNIAHRKDIPKTKEEALLLILQNYSKEEQTLICTHHLAALPGWTGYINYRTQSDSDWQKEFPIDLEDYLAVRLFCAYSLGLKIEVPTASSAVISTEDHLAYLWLKAWEQTWQDTLKITLEAHGTNLNAGLSQKKPDAQLVFCIDTRSELIRRHLESKGAYETFGYAGFFGIAMDYINPDDGLVRKSCPPIVGSAYSVKEAARPDYEKRLSTYQNTKKQGQFFQYFLNRMKNMLPSAFGYVEGTGVFYGIFSLVRTLVPGYSYRAKNKPHNSYEHLCETSIHLATDEIDQTTGIPLDQKVGIVKSAFDLLGWNTFARLVIFAGHGSHSANNPFGSSLDCGACAASPGKHNARMLARLANLPEVRAQLASVHGIHIPQDTWFIGAQHNTTTDEIELFEYDIPTTHKEYLKNLKNDLYKVQQTATQERLGGSTKSIAKAQKKANNWGETRPEWGLAKNAGFIIAPRSLTKDIHLDGRCFLHSYDWRLDASGSALEGIMQGPMVVTQWINNHYYFSTVDNDAFGGGSKVTHNITGKFGVVQGNGGDLKMGLPLQSVYQTDDEGYHKALRLSVCIQAPVQRVSKILVNNEHLKTLLDNEWMYLMVMDPTQNNEIVTYSKNLAWISKKQPSQELNLTSIVKQEVLA